MHIFTIISEISENLKQNKIYKDLSVYIGSNILGQMIGIMCSPILTRLFSPESYGIQSVYLSLISLACVISTLSYQNAIVISDDEDEISVIILGFLTLLLFCVLVSILIGISENSILRLLNCEQLTPYSFLIPVSIFFISSYNIMNQYAIKYKLFSLISRTKITQNIWGNLGKIILGFLKTGTAGLLIGNLLSQSVGVFKLFKQFISSSKNLIIQPVKLKSAANKYKSFPLYSTPCNCIYTFGNQIPVLMLSSLYGSSISGYYSLAYSVICLPCNIIGVAMSQVFFAEIAERRKSKSIIGFINSLLKKVAFFSAILFAVLWLILPHAFSLIYGESWYIAGKFAQILTIQTFAYFVILPVSKVFEVFQKQKLDLIINAFRVIILLLVFYFSGKMQLEPIHAITLFSVLGALVYIVSIIIMEIMLQRLKFEYE